MPVVAETHQFANVPCRRLRVRPMSLMGITCRHCRPPRAAGFASDAGMGGSTGRPSGGFDLIAQGIGGIMPVTGEPDGPPTSVGVPICDLGTGMWAVQGILVALYQRSASSIQW